MRKNFPHDVIRIRRGESNFSKIHKIIVISNKKKTSSQKVFCNLGFFRYGNKRMLSINYKKLAEFLNKGIELKNSVKRLLLLNTFYKIKKKKKRKKKWI